MKEWTIMLLLIPVGAIAIAVATLRFGRDVKETIAKSIDIQHGG